MTTLVSDSVPGPLSRHTKYNRSPAGIARRKRYAASPKGKRKDKLYWASPRVRIKDRLRDQQLSRQMSRSLQRGGEV